MASHVQILLDNFNNVLTSKVVREELKNVLLVTLKYLIEQLNFYTEDFSYDSPMGILWP